MLAHAQSIKVGEFRQDPSARPVTREDFGGSPCAAIRIPTSDRAFCFEAGLVGIVDVAYTADDITIYIPSDTRVLSVSHRSYGVLRDWVIPATLQEGCTYTMKLTCSPKGAESRTMKPVQFASRPVTASAPVRAPRPRASYGDFAISFLDFSFGFANTEDWTDRMVTGLSYTYIQSGVGPYVGAYYMASDEGDPSLSMVMGASARLTRDSGPVDWQLYAGAGLDITARPVYDLGTRVNIGGHRSWGMWDFGVGCMYWDGKMTPKASVGLGIWGGGILVTICLVGMTATAF